MLSPATKPPCGLAARRSLRLAAQRVGRSEQRIERSLTSNCSANCGSNCGTNCGTTPTVRRPRVSLVPVRDFEFRRFSTSLSRPSRRLFGTCSGFVLWFGLRYALHFALWFALWFMVPAYGMSCFADGCAGFRRCRGFDISTTSNCGRSIALLAVRTGLVVVARRRLSRIARRVALAPDPLCVDVMGSGRLE
jgi:hypothetical protein